ncbi:MAG: ABC transporter permease [Clostridia bacterium]|nr:ABC transporter permease [Clostridia bacterium]
MFFRMIRGALFRQKGKMLMIAFTIALGASLATAMLNVMMDVGDKVNQELKTYGANITVVPKENSVLDELYEVDGEEIQSAYLREDELGKIKTIFWAFNIVDFSPFIDTTVTLDNGSEVKLTGTWFNHHLDLPTGETLNTGVTNLRNWWDIESGVWLDEQAAGGTQGVMVGTQLAKDAGISAGDTLTVSTRYGKKQLAVVGIYNAGGDEDDQLFSSLDIAQALSNTEGCLSSIEVSALTTPDNELARKAAKDPGSLSIAQYEQWYCTAYVSSICYQIQEVITGSIASPVRQVAESEGAIMDKTELLMILITILSLVGAALGISNLVTASVMERSNEIGLLKAIGAKDSSISGIVLTEIMSTAVIGGVAGYFLGYGFAQIIGQTVFGSAIEMKLMVIPIVAISIIVVTLAGSIPAIRMLLRLRPAEVLHGR